jgi:carbamoyl-phosphate synthase large subunit
MNPRVSRSSALASKATGFPIAKIAAKLAVGYTLDEIPNDITRETPACFEPTIDYVVTKIPRFTFEKFPQAADTLGPQMKSVGEAMAIGRTFKESLQKAMRSLEIGSFGFEPRAQATDAELRERLRVPNADRLWHVGEAFRRGMTVAQVADLTKIDPWFLRHVEEIVAEEHALFGEALDRVAPDRLRALKRQGFADARLAELLDTTEDAVRACRERDGVEPVYKTVDTCGAEFEAYTPYLYSSYEPGGDESRPTRKRKVVILGGGPNRIGQGIEFDYCCVHAALALRGDGFETIMVNCNPETVSTDYDTSDKLYFEPLTLEDTLALIRRERPDGVVVQFGGQTPLRLAVPLERAGVPIVGTTPDSIDRAEDRERFEEVLAKLRLERPPNGVARSAEEAVRVAESLGYPILVRPSYVLGGRAMEIVYDRDSLARYMRVAVRVSPAHPVLIDKFLEDAIEVDVDAVSDGREVVIGGIMEHIERAGVHSGDSACSLPPYSLDAAVQADIRRQTVALARELGVVGLMNVQFAVKANCVLVLEVNPRASRTVPFVSKAIGVPLAKIAVRCMVGRSLAEQGFTREIVPTHVNVKEAVFPFIKFPGVDTVLGPEMKSTGEVMGIDGSFGAAFAKAQIAAATLLPTAGRAFISVPQADYDGVLPVARRLAHSGFSLLATRGTAERLAAAGVPVEVVNKVSEGGPHIVDALRRGDVALVVNTPAGADSQRDAFHIRRTALECRVPYFTTLAAAAAAAEGIELMRRGPVTVRPLQEHHRR